MGTPKSIAFELRLGRASSHTTLPISSWRDSLGDHYAVTRFFRLTEYEWSGNMKGEVKTQPVASDDRLFAGTDTGFVYAFATPEGSELWEARVPGEVEDVAVSEELVWVTDDQEGVYAFLKESGRQVIERPDEQAEGTQALQDTILIIGSKSSLNQITTV